MDDNAGRVLVVGDPETLEALRNESTLAGCEVEGCAGEVQALHRLRRKSHDVVVTGRWTTMDKDLAFLEEARSARPGVRGIVIVASAERGEVIEAMRKHVFALFTAPFDTEEVASMVARAIRERNWKDDIELISALPDWITLRVAARRLSAERLVRFMDEIQAGVEEQSRRGLLDAFRELLLNAMEHGSGFDADRTVEVSAVRTDRAIVFHFRDAGSGFRLDQLDHAAIANPPGDPIRHMVRREELGLRPGGFGILIAQRVADELYFNQAGNQVLLIKHTK
jgi:anti-sigma regulatory factor (Ser/Thr protein kinase)/CheY-like chemotaxis protein